MPSKGYHLACISLDRLSVLGVYHLIEVDTASDGSWEELLVREKVENELYQDERDDREF
jgi:hypothetical protein